jgi:hypothetical protein
MFFAQLDLNAQVRIRTPTMLVRLLDKLLAVRQYQCLRGLVVAWGYTLDELGEYDL